ncbi:MAG: tRNA (N(6)-L-threonylcarbamoyladenosine(37)-C(2))-methylthiotransferase [Candidatus Bathyarchaeota archaeon]|nr:tRNA (N(6)-L-threonylcarbamoyladenosine(37)-C(2))-methylthiotransferase [Candidatus Bathyarchaeota archaeon]MDD4325273.1 tRNA (N(6)-L-threonylcarbamoyladenosine(37)-C(2))-methylthiotransferase [Candidatus Bathyarchaeota archaeon]MDI9578414.1 tRNA (N(6)-L-threonylcarbamoyladenosine(37)-C(2))-methylthiotransferase [Thermoproteota archaeon]MDT8783028.1 tRNA (N(6)-L-threonylcarbamoyladenosine(37)-C(2))-methylthiotransferase [Candidatus Bathyarchaeota archaeon]
MENKIFIKNYGCSANIADGEVITGCLEQAGYTLTTSETEANLIIFNTCAVKGPTENRIIAEIKQVPKHKKIVIAGCLPTINFDRLSREVHFNGAIGPAIGDKIVNIIERVLAGQKVTELGTGKEKPNLNLPKQRTNPIISIVPINYGCLGSCSYCCVKHARGHLRSYSEKEIVDRVQEDFDTGVREFWITSQDTASYGRDLQINLANLLGALDKITGDFKIRVGMMTPNLVMDIQESLIAAFGSDKIFKFVHLPVQSGDNTVLKNMNRFYTIQEFKEIVEIFRGEFPDLTLATDVIVGFPGETKQAFQNTMDLLKTIKPDVVNVSKFFARPKTAALDIKEGIVDKEEIKQRSSVMSELTKKLSSERNKRWIGWTGKILVDEKGKVSNSWMGRNFAYKPIIVNSEKNLLGKIVTVEVSETFGTYLKGEAIKEQKETGS